MNNKPFAGKISLDEFIEKNIKENPVDNNKQKNQNKQNNKQCSLLVHLRQLF